MEKLNKINRKRNKVPRTKVFMLYSFKGWILEGIARESSHAFGNRIKLVFIPTDKSHLFNIINTFIYLLNRKPGQENIYINQKTFFKVINKKNLNCIPGSSKVLYTHFSEVKELSKLQQVELLVHADLIFVLNKRERKNLILGGVPPYKIKVIYGAIDRKKYYPQSFKCSSQIEKSYVIVIGDCKERKNPDLILKVILKMPNQKFIIHGNGWEEYYLNKFKHTPSNVEFKRFKLNLNPQLVRYSSSYLSLSTLEGGPYPTLEALASGTPVVVTNTGWNSEVVKKSNGVLLSSRISTDEVVKALKITLKLKSRVKSYDLLDGKFTWEEFGKNLYGN
jgi:glycosyltransferase involved in cell wall biosynthesis